MSALHAEDRALSNLRTTLGAVGPCSLRPTHGAELIAFLHLVSFSANDVLEGHVHIIGSGELPENHCSNRNLARVNSYDSAKSPDKYSFQIASKEFRELCSRIEVCGNTVVGGGDRGLCS